MVVEGEPPEMTVDKFLEKRRADMQERISELIQAAPPKFVPFAKAEGGLTTRQYVVTLYEENTEYLGCLGMLAEIAKWFSVTPLLGWEDIGKES